MIPTPATTVTYWMPSEKPKKPGQTARDKPKSRRSDPDSARGKLEQAMRDELASVRFRHGLPNQRAVVWRLGINAEVPPGNSMANMYWRFEGGRVDWPIEIGEIVEDYATAAGIDPLAIWLGAIERWKGALMSGAGERIGRRLVRQAGTREPPPTDERRSGSDRRTRTQREG